MRVAVAEDGGLFRAGLTMLLETLGHEVVGSTPDGDSLAAVLRTTPADVAILDIRMPPGPQGGLVTARRLRSQHPELGLLLLSHYAEVAYLTQMLEIGVERAGYRLKEKVSDVVALGETLDRIVAGDLVIEPVLAGRLVERANDRAADGLSDLSERETEVLRLMAEGRSNPGIAEQLHVSVKAVEKYISIIFTKLHLPIDQNAHHRRVLAVLTYLRVNRPA